MVLEHLVLPAINIGQAIGFYSEKGQIFKTFSLPRSVPFELKFPSGIAHCIM